MKKSQLNLKISSKFRSSKDVTFLCAALLISAVALYVYAGPAYAEKTALEESNAVKELDLQGKRELLANIQSFNKENADLGTNSKKLAAFIPSRDNYEDFFIHVKEVARGCNLEFVSFSLVEKKATPKVLESAAADADAAATDGEASSYEEKRSFTLNEQGVDIEVSGDFENIEDFMKELENGIPFIQEGSLNIALQTDSQSVQAAEVPEQASATMLTSVISFNFYYY